MEHLSTLDAGFLEAEDSDEHVSLAIGSVSVVEGPIPEHHSLAAELSDRILTVDRFRQVLRIHRLDLGPPQWVNDPHFDLAHHVHRAALPAPGDHATLFGFVADVMSRRLDREHPLWECWIVEGLAENQWAILMKIHHCIADGIASMHMLAGLADGGAGDTFASRVSAPRQESDRSGAVTGFGLNPFTWPSRAWRVATTVTGTTGLVLEGALEITSGLLRRAAPSSLIGPLTTMRRYSAARVALDDVATVCSRFDVTLNDVALAAITDSFRAGLIRRGVQPRRTSLPTLVPVSVRSGEAADIADNRVAAMLPYLPVDKAHPIDQLYAVHQRMVTAKASGQRQASTLFVSAMNVVPFPLTAWAVRALTRLPQRGVVTLATNVPGPRERLRIMDRQVVCVYPVPPIAIQLRTGIAILSYADQLVFGITADFDAAPDVEEIAGGIESAVARLAALSRQG